MAHQSIPFVNSVKDGDTRQALVAIWQAVQRLQGGGGRESQINSTLNLQSNRITGVASPSEGSDAVPLDYADSTYGSRAHQRELSAGGGFPLDVTNLTGILARPQFPRLFIVLDFLPPIDRFEDGALIWSAVDGYFYFRDSRTPTAVWTPIIPGPTPNTPGGGGAVGTGTGPAPGPGTCGGLSNEPDCPRLCAGGKYAGAVDSSQSVVEHSHPEYFVNPSANPLVLLEAQKLNYVASVVDELNTPGKYGVQAEASPGTNNEITVITTTSPVTFSEGYAIFASNLEPRRNPGSYRATCTPSRF